MKTRITCLSVGQLSHCSPVLHISQHPPHNVNYNNNTSSGRMRRTEGGKRGGKYIITDRENLSQIKSGKGEGHRTNDEASALCEYALILIRESTNESGG